MQQRPLLWVVRFFYAAASGNFILLSILGLLSALLNAGSLVLLKRLVDGETGGTGLIFYAVVYILFALVFPNAVGILQSLLREKVLRRSQQDLTARILQQSAAIRLEKLEDPDYQNLLNMVTKADSSLLINYWLSCYGIVTSLVQLAGVSAVLFGFYWGLPFLLALAILPEFITNFLFARMRHRLFVDQSVVERRFTYYADLITDPQSMKELRTSRLHDFFFKRWKAQKTEYDQVHFKFEKKRQTFVGVSQLFFFTSLTAMMFVITSWVSDGRTTAGAFISVIFALNYVMQAIYQLMHHANQIQNDRYRVTMLIEFLQDADVEQPSTEDGSQEPGALDISFENVSYRYPGTDRPALDGVSFAIQGGERIALVGANGSGKSTLIRLMLGLCKPTEGRILINGEPLTDETLAKHRKNITVAFQDFSRYYRTVRENIGYGHLPSLGVRSAIEQAAVRSGADAVAEQMERGYEQQLGVEFANGVDLSGGQWQKLAIARAYIRPAALLVMDEPTASLDPEAEVEVYRQFTELAEGRTALLVSHRLGSAVLADRVLVLKEGRLIEEGTHAELLERDGEYQKLFSVQAEWYRSPAAKQEVAVAHD